MSQKIGHLINTPVTNLMVTHFLSFTHLICADSEGGLTSPTPAGKRGYGVITNGNSLYQQGNQGYGNPPNVQFNSFGSTFRLHQPANQARTPRAVKTELPSSDVYGSDDTYGVKREDRKPQVYKSELPTPAPSDHNFSVNNQGIQANSLPPPNDEKPDVDDDEFNFESNWMSEIDLNGIHQAPTIPSSCKHFDYDLTDFLDDPLPSSDIKDIRDDEPPVTAEMIEQRKLQKEQLEKKRKEEISLTARKEAGVQEGQIAVQDIGSKFL
jgi:hypothetical protein